MYLIVVDTMQIQPYIFGSNRLRENLGASYLVAQATQDWAQDCAPEPNNLKPKGTYDPFRDSPFKDTEHIEHNGQLKAEVVYAGGGNFVALIREEGDAKKFIRDLSLKVLRDAPGLQILVACRPFHWNESGVQDDSLVTSIRAAFVSLAEEKRQRTQTSPLLGLSVTVPCQGTGLPAVEWATPIETETGYPASAEICAKLNAVDDANIALADAFGDRIPFRYEFPYDLDHMGRSEGEFSHVAIVHADGDSMSERFSAIAAGRDAAEKNREYVTNVRELSENVKRKSRAALGNMLTRLARQIDEEQHCITYKKDGRLVAKIGFQQSKKNGNWWLPFRPIVYGGDDVTFVCDGRLGLALAVEYLQQFQQSFGATACAGITVIKTHYPFARGYALADDLCQSAKKYRATNHLTDVCAMDWHFALSGLAGDLDEIREREYTTRAGKLYLRPVVLTTQDPPPLQSWQATEKFTRDFQSKDWMTRRNKAKGLRDALRGGEVQVKRFRTMYSEKDKPIDLPDGFAPHPKQVVTDKAPEKIHQDIREMGWVHLQSESPKKEEKRAVYFDALELADWYVPLKPLEKQP